MKVVISVAWTIGVVLAGCEREPTTRGPARRANDFEPSPLPTLAELEASAARLPRCAVPVVDDVRAWPARRLPGVGGAVRLPPGYVPDTATRADEATLSWTAPDSGYVTAMLSNHLGGTFLIQPEGAASSSTHECAVPLFGRLARARLVSAAIPIAGDTLFIVTLDAPVDARREIGAGAMHRRAGARDTLLAALATMRLDR